LPATLRVIHGRAVTLTHGVVDHARLFLHGDRIEAVRATGQAAPAGYVTAPVLQTGGTLYPGLVDLHNHLPYNILQLWPVPESFRNRNCWRRDDRYARDISRPMAKLAARGATARHHAIARYVEAKLLLGGTTSVQGMGSKRGAHGQMYSGLVRNLEAPDEAGLPAAGIRVLDVSATEGLAEIRQGLGRDAPFFFHLAEGLDSKAAAQFDLLKGADLLKPNLVCIHCLGLGTAAHQCLEEARARVVWSPLSNLLLYGETLNPSLLRKPFALGCDWTPSGSKNLLHELKVAWLVLQQAGPAVDACESLVRAVTLDAARIAQWSHGLGALEAGLLADLLVIDSTHTDPYENLVRATERELRLVLIDGVPRHGDLGLMQACGLGADSLEACTVGGRSKALHLHQPESPLQGLSLNAACLRLEQATSQLDQLLVRPDFLNEGESADLFELELDMQADPLPVPLDQKVLLPDLTSVALDALTVVDDPGHFDRLEANRNLPAYLKGPTGLRAFYT